MLEKVLLHDGKESVVNFSTLACVIFSRPLPFHDCLFWVKLSHFYQQVAEKERKEGSGKQKTSFKLQEFIMFRFTAFHEYHIMQSQAHFFLFV